MRTQSADTHPEVERIMIELIRKAPISKRFRLVQSLTQGALWSSIHAWRESHRGISEQEAAVHVVSCYYGTALVRQVQEALELHKDWHAQPIELVAAMLPALHAFDHLRVPYYLAGSIASSLHGMQQLTQDIDLVVDLPENAITPLMVLLNPYYALHEAMLWEAARTHTPYSLIHLDSLMKVDMIFPRQEAFDVSMRRFVTRQTLDDRSPAIWLASASEMILFKLRRYQRDAQLRTNGMQDDAEWNDILGMLKVQGPDLDLAFLEEWAIKLNVTEMWHRALVDAGLRED